ncbi:MAG: hypothetical protein C0595_07140 [Marinilabiliales bacterium]|nr:MAG: hypothetical protein C0595_07140 [Marinilabiliales bacterium]
MKKQLLTIILLLFIGYGFSQNYSLTLNVKNCDPSGGKIMIAGFKGANDFNKKENSAFNKAVVVNDSTVEVNFHNISSGKYAIAIYHDQNIDNKLNTNQIGIPTEGFGFSGDYSLFKKPKFNDCSFEVNNDTTIVINMHYLWN